MTEQERHEDLLEKILDNKALSEKLIKSTDEIKEAIQTTSERTITAVKETGAETVNAVNQMSDKLAGLMKDQTETLRSALTGVDRKPGVTAHASAAHVPPPPLVPAAQAHARCLRGSSCACGTRENPCELLDSDEEAGGQNLPPKDTATKLKALKDHYVFDGADGESSHKYVREMIELKKKFMLGKSDFKTVVLYNLKGDANKYIRSQPDNKVQTGTQILKLISERWDPEDSRLSAQTRFNGRKQREAEGFKSFLLELESLRRLGWPSEDELVTRKSVYHHMLNGLTKRKLQKHFVQAFSTRCFDDAPPTVAEITTVYHNFAKGAHPDWKDGDPPKGDEAHGSRLKVPQLKKSPEPAQKGAHGGDKKGKACHECGSLDHKMKDCPLFKARLIRNAAEDEAQELCAVYNDRDRWKRESKNMDNVLCYNCNGKGHYARDCPHPQKPRPTEGYQNRNNSTNQYQKTSIDGMATMALALAELQKQIKELKLEKEKAETRGNVKAVEENC